MAQVVAVAGHHRLDHGEVEGVRGDVDPPDRAQDGSAHLVVDDQRLGRGDHDRSQHPDRELHHVRSRLGGQRHGVALLVAGLGVGHLGVGDAGRHGVGQPERVEQLGGPGGGHRGLPSPAGHGPGAQVRHERHEGVDGRVARLDGVDQHDGGQDLGQPLGQGAGERGGAGGSGLPGGAGLDHHASLDGGLDDVAPVVAEPQRRDDVDGDRHAERPPGEGAGRSESEVEQVDDRIDVVRGGEADTGRLASGGHTGEGGVQVEVPGGGCVPADQGAQAVVDVGARVDDPHHRPQIGQGGGAVRPGGRVERLDRSAAGADVHRPAADAQSTVLHEAGQIDPRRRPLDGRLDHRPGKREPPVVALDRTACHQPVASAGRRARQPDIGEDGEGVLDDGVAAVVGQRPVGASPRRRSGRCRRLSGLPAPAPGHRSKSVSAVRGGQRVAGPDAAALIVESPDAAVAEIVAGWPSRFDTARAAALGFAADAAYDDIIQAYMEDDA